MDKKEIISEAIQGSHFLDGCLVVEIFIKQNVFIVKFFFDKLSYLYSTSEDVTNTPSTPISTPSISTSSTIYFRYFAR